MLYPQLPVDRASVIRYTEEITGLFACKKDRLRGQEVDKLTVYFPAFRHRGGKWGNAHTVAEAKRAAFGTEFCARHFWFDPKTDLWLQRDCGCKPPGYRETIEYPSPESVPPELFQFEVPPGALLKVDDPALGRQIRSEGKSSPTGRIDRGGVQRREVRTKAWIGGTRADARQRCGDQQRPGARDGRRAIPTDGRYGHLTQMHEDAKETVRWSSL